MKSKIYSSEYLKTSSKGQMWLPAFAMIAFLLAFPVTELLSLGRWSNMDYTQNQLSYLYSSLWSSGFLQMGAAAAAAAAFFAALSGFWYLYSPRKVDFYHSLPVKRSGLFFHRVLLAVLYYIIPYAIMEFLAVCIGATRGYYSLEIMKKALLLFLIHLLMYLVVYFSTVLVISVTGTILMGALAWAGLFFYSIILVLMLQLSGTFFFKTWYDRDYGILAAVKNYGSPLAVILKFITAYMSGAYQKEFVILILAMVIMAVASYMAFCKRRSENTGKALVYPWMEPVLSTLVTIPSGIGIGMIFYMITDGSSWTAWWIFGMVFGTILVHGIMQVIFTMDFRKFFRRKIELLCLGGVVAVCALTMKMDLLGYDSYFPSYEKLQGVAVYVGNLNYSEQLYNIEKTDDGTYRIQYNTSTDATAVMEQPVLGQNEALYNSLKDIKLQNEKEKTEERTGNPIYVRYVTKSGRSVCRTYYVVSDQAQNLMEALYGDKTWREKNYSFLQIEDKYLEEISGIFCDGYSHTLFEKDSRKQEALLQALREDISDAGGAAINEQPCALLMLTYGKIPSEGYYDQTPAVRKGETVDTSVLIYPSYKRTLAILEKTGYPLSVNALPVESINVYYYGSGSDADLEETENGYKVSYDDPEQLKALEKCIRPGTLVNSWNYWKADVNVEVRLKGQSADEDGIFMSFAGAAPDFIKTEAKAANVTEWR